MYSTYDLLMEVYMPREVLAQRPMERPPPQLTSITRAASSPSSTCAHYPEQSAHEEICRDKKRGIEAAVGLGGEEKRR